MAALLFKGTIINIANKLNVTPSTVLRALNDHAAISDATNKAALKTAKKINYHSNKIASSLRSGTSKIIGIILSSAEINLFGSVVHGIEKIASEKSYSVLLYQSNERMVFEKKGLAAFLRSRVDGVFVSISKEITKLDHYREVKARGIPLLLFDRASKELEVPSIVIDDYKGAFIATSHLVRQGCQHIAHIISPQHIHIFMERLRGYLNTLQQADLPHDKNLVVYRTVSIGSRSRIQQLLSSSNNIDGVHAAKDFTALGAMQSLKETGKKYLAMCA